MKDNPYSELDQFLGICLSQDYDIFGSNLAEIVEYYKKTAEKNDIDKLIREVVQFKVDNFDDLDNVFDATYGREVSIQAWGYTTASFLDELKRLLQE
ncbi:contact-dependent growth inhibition system immunity protein [Trinickia mobilis]|uniref:contact-dependent growth inhibition system immunity protein n=1 Tax=Trinickia mobilis TaxID=2816356 RepID=UPI00210592A7|nr:contact-dependent growth inhibition system immunity protein [Trinickia mobilis]